MAEGFKNPFRPGAGHMPPYLAGREAEQDEFRKLLEQDTITENLILTGLRGVGKTVLLDTFKPIAQRARWLWVGTDLSETASVSETTLAERLLTDLSVVTSTMTYEITREPGLFNQRAQRERVNLDFSELAAWYEATPGLVADKLKYVLNEVWRSVPGGEHRGVVFAYDEAQNLSDHAGKEQYPLSVLLDVFQSIQRSNIPMMLVLTGLPTLFPKLVEARTFSERMFHTVFLDRLNKGASRAAILTPITKDDCPIRFEEASVNTIIQVSGGYPYFIQFICREVYDLFLLGHDVVPVDAITRKLDTDFFAGRWARATDRQRDLLFVIAQLPNCDNEFTVQEVVERSKSLSVKAFSPSHVNQMLVALCNAGLVYKNRHGKYTFAVPLLGEFIKRQNKHGAA